MAGSVVLILGFGALLWFVVFPAIDPHLPFNNDGNVTSTVGPNGPLPTSVAPPNPSST